MFINILIYGTLLKRHRCARTLNMFMVFASHVRHTLARRLVVLLRENIVFLILCLILVISLSVFRRSIDNYFHRSCADGAIVSKGPRPKLAPRKEASQVRLVERLKGAVLNAYWKLCPAWHNLALLI